MLDKKDSLSFSTFPASTTNELRLPEAANDPIFCLWLSMSQLWPWTLKRIEDVLVVNEKIS